MARKWLLMAEIDELDDAEKKKYEQVRLIINDDNDDEEGDVGEGGKTSSVVISLQDAKARLESAIQKLPSIKESVLKLLVIVPDATPPVCRIVDYNKFLYQEKLKEKQRKKQQRQALMQLKEVKFRVATDEGDFQVKLRNVRRFLEGGHKVKVTLRFRGREVVHHELGRERMEQVIAGVNDISMVDQMPRLEGRQIVMVLSPKRDK